MSRVLSLALLAALAGALPTVPAQASEDAAAFMSRFSGAWLGTGELLLGSESGMKFNCELSGDPSRSQLSFAMKGKCWMGALSAPVHARLRYNQETNAFYGEFMGGADEDGANIMGVRDGDGFSLKLTRGTAQGRLAAETVNADQMTITIFYRDRTNKRELPVVAMGFTRKDSGLTLPDYKAGVAEGAVTGAN